MLRHGRVWTLLHACGVVALAASVPAMGTESPPTDAGLVVRLTPEALARAGYTGTGALMIDGVRLEPVIKHGLERDTPAADRLRRSFVVDGAVHALTLVASPGFVGAAEHIETVPVGGQHVFAEVQSDLLVLPNDPMFDEQRSLIAPSTQAPGVEVGIGVQLAWSISTGSGARSEPVVVGVLDARVAAGHPELAGAVLEGYNAVEGGSNTSGGSDWHGTHIAGLIAARANNFEGIAGISWGAQILPVRVVSNSGFGTAGWFADGLTWAADAGADVVNISLGYPVGSDIMEDAVEYALDAGVVIVASSGNSPGAPVAYPAAYDDVIAVGAMDGRGEIWPNTSIGPELDLLAPGVDIFSLVDSPSTPNGYGRATGTSFAAPHVAGTVALMLAENPDLTPDDVVDYLLASATVRDTSQSSVAADFPRLNALAALAIANGGEADCAGDLNDDGAVDTADLILFLGLFEARDPAADLEVPFGQFDIFDVLAFFGSFVVPCG